MTVLGFVKGILVFISLFGIVFLGIGAWKVYTAFTFVQQADKAIGTFKGYHTVYNETTTTDDFYQTKRTRVEEALPMYAYTDAHGNLHDATGTESHFFKHLRFGQKVKVLVAPDGSGVSRLGDLLSLYGNAVLLSLVGLGCIVLMYYGIKAMDMFLGPSAQPVATNSVISFLQSSLHEFGQSRLPISSMVFYLGGFVLIAIVMGAFTIHMTYKRQDPALIKALQQQQYDTALVLAAQGRGVDVKTAEGESALILALKANQPILVRAILNCLFVNANVWAADKRSSAQIAAANGDLQTLTLLIQKGASAAELEPSLIHDLIIKGNAALLKLIFNDGYNLYQRYNQLFLGDYAVIEGRAEIVRLIQARHGTFRAPATFIALALNDPVALRTALKRRNAAKFRFCGYTLEQFAQKINRQELLAMVQNDDNPSK